MQYLNLLVAPRQTCTMEIDYILKNMCLQRPAWYVCACTHKSIYLCNSLQAHIVALVLALFQFLQSHSHLSDEFISSESVHVTHTQPFRTHTHTDCRDTEKQVSQWKVADELHRRSLLWSKRRLCQIYPKCIWTINQLLRLQHKTGSRWFHVSSLVNDKLCDCWREKGFQSFPSWLSLHQRLICCYWNM